MFGFNKKNTTEKVNNEQVKESKAKDILDELNEKLKPFKVVKSKGEVIITELYKRHGIKIETTWYGIEDAWLDDEVIKDLCVFNEQELVTLEKWISKYKEARTAEDQMILKYSKEARAQYEHRINDNM